MIVDVCPDMQETVNMLAQVLYNCAWMKALGYVINDLFWIVVVVCFSFCFVFVYLFVFCYILMSVLQL